jgi:hypothetical protein
VASNSEGKLNVVDAERTHYWVREMFLIPMSRTVRRDPRAK